MRTVRIAIEVVGYLIGFPLQILIIAALLRGAYKRYPFVFAYATSGFLASAIELPLNYLGKPYRSLYVHTWWIDERIHLALVYAVVISLIYEATASLRSRRIVRSAVIGGAFLFAGVTFLINFDSSIQNTGQWMTPWTSELYFCAAVLDLGLWAMLIGVRVRNRRLLVLSGALGILFTGEAIGESVRQLSQSRHSVAVALIGNVVLMAANQVFLYLWWQAFRTAAEGDIQPPVPLRSAKSTKQEA